MKDPLHRSCKAKSRRSGLPCRGKPIRGGFVCRMHGGGAPAVKRKAAERLADLIDPNRALREAARLAYADIRELFDDRGRLKPINEWPKDLAAAVGSVEVVKRNVDSHDGKTDDVIKIRIWDKVRALEMLFKHLGLLKDRLDLAGGIEIRWQGEMEDKLAEGRRRVAEAAETAPTT